MKHRSLAVAGLTSAVVALSILACSQPVETSPEAVGSSQQALSGPGPSFTCPVPEFIGYLGGNVKIPITVELEGNCKADGTKQEPDCQCLEVYRGVTLPDAGAFSDAGALPTGLGAIGTFYCTAPYPYSHCNVLGQCTCWSS